MKSDQKIEQGPKVIVFEGGIGAGKTSANQVLRELFPNSVFIDEPLDQWNSVDILNKFYQDPKKYAYVFQSLAFITRLVRHMISRDYQPKVESIVLDYFKKLMGYHVFLVLLLFLVGHWFGVDLILALGISILLLAISLTLLVNSHPELRSALFNNDSAKIKNCDYIFLERSIYADKYCFAKNLFQQEIMNETEWKVYNLWFDTMVDKFKNEVRVDLFIYLKASPEACMNRIKSRDRKAESTIELDYLIKLGQAYDDWMKTIPDSKKLVVDMEQPWLGGKKKDYPHKLAELITDKLNQI